MDLSLPQIWLIIGMIMLLAELVSVLLVFVFFAIGALITALLASLGILPNLEIQLILFSIISLSSLAVLRKPAKRIVESRGKQFEYNEFIGETALVIKDVPANGEGKIYYKGAEWKAVSFNNMPIGAGNKVIIIRTKGIVLVVEES